MSPLHASVLVAFLTIALSTTLAVAGWALKRAIVSAIDKLAVEVVEVRQEVARLREEVLKDYVTKSDHHETAREVGSLRERIASIEATCNARHNDGK